MASYRPRRANKTRWLANAPDYILDVLDNRGKTADRYTIIFGGEFIFHNGKQGTATGPGEYHNTYVQYLTMSEAPSHPQGVSMWGEMSAYDQAGFRYRSSHDRIAWDSLPENIKAHVIARAKTDE